MYILTERELENKLREIAEKEAMSRENSLEEAEVSSEISEKTSLENNKYWQCFLMYLSDKDKISWKALELYLSYCKDEKIDPKIFLGYGEYIRQQIEILKNKYKKLVEIITDGHGFLCVCDNDSNFAYETASTDLIIVEQVTNAEKQMLESVLQRYNLSVSDCASNSEKNYGILEKLFSLAKTGEINYEIPFKFFFAYVVKKTKYSHQWSTERYYVNRTLFQDFVVSKFHLFDLKMRSDQILVKAGYYRLLEEQYNLTTHYLSVLNWPSEAKYKISAIKLPSRYIEVVQ